MYLYYLSVKIGCMKFTFDKKQLITYLLCLGLLFLSIVYLGIDLHKNGISAQEPAATEPTSGGTCGPVNNKVGYNIGGYGCGDSGNVLAWAVQNGGWVNVQMNEYCVQPNSDIPIQEIVDAVAAGGRGLIIRLYPGGSLNKGYETRDATRLANCLKAVDFKGVPLYIEPHNEVNWISEEMRQYNKDPDEVARALGIYIRTLNEQFPANYLFPSMNAYPNSGTIDPAVLAPKILAESGISFAGISLHMYAGSPVTLFAGGGGSCGSNMQDCLRDIQRASTGGDGALMNLPIFVTELGYIEDVPKYGDPNSAWLLGKAWKELSQMGNVVAITPLIYDPLATGGAQSCSGYKLPATGTASDQFVGMSSLVAVASYMGCDVDVERIRSMTRTELVDYMLNELGIGNCDACSYPYEQITCGTECICSSYWTCCNGIPTFGRKGVCIYPEWGNVLPKCKGSNAWRELKCSDTVDGYMRSDQYIDPANPPEVVSCNCDVRLSVLPVSRAHQPYGMIGTTFLSVRLRLGDLGYIPCIIPGTCWNSNPIYASEAPTSYKKTIFSIKVDSRGGNFTLSPESGQNVAKGAVEDEAVSIYKMARWIYSNDLPGTTEYETRKRQVTSLIDNACDGGFTPIISKGLDYCEIDSFWWKFDPIVKTWRDIINGSCEVEVDRIAFYTEELFKPLETATIKHMRTIVGLPGQQIKCEEPTEVATLAKAKICGKEHEVKLYYLGIARSMACYGSAASALAPPGSKIEESYMKFL